ncbi:hypothetical protein AAVH_40124, partial [Aphelenchoides avenae]
GESACPSGYTEVGRKCYKFNAEAAGFDKAVEICERDGGHLPVISNDEENRHIA